MRNFDSIPPEIWLAIALHLSPQQVNKLAPLCRTFAALARERNEERHRMLHLTERLPADTDSSNDGNTIFELLDTLKARKDQVHLPPVRKLIFSQFVDINLPARPQSAGTLSQLSQFFGRRSVSSAAVKHLYEHFPAVNSIQFSFDGMTNRLGTQFGRFAATTLTAFSSNLRELSISMDASSWLGLCLPATKSTSSLSRLEIVRLSFWTISPFQSEPEKKRVRQLVQLYETATLRTLEIEFKHYKSAWWRSLNSFLPSLNAVRALRTLSVWLPNDKAYSHSRGDHIGLLAFIQGNQATLVQLAIHGFSGIDNEFGRNPPVFRSDVALSFRSWETHWIGRASATLRSLVLELEYIQQGGEYWPFAELENLQVLRLHLRDFNLSSFVRLAEQAPQLTSLRLEYSTNHAHTMTHDMRHDIATASEGTKFVLGHWSLRDLAILSKWPSPENAGYSQQMMSLMVNILPSVVTFDGQDMRDLPLRSHGTQWIWTRNKYLLSAAAERRRAAAG